MPEGTQRTNFARQRQAKLLEILRTQGSVVVSEVAPQLRVSELTIRRDINTLADRGLVARVHGGATLLEQRTPFRPPLPRRTKQTYRYTFGVVVPSVEYYWSSVIAGMRAAATEAQVRLILRSSAYDIVEDRRHIGVMASTEGIDGLIVAPDVTHSDSRDLLEWLDRLELPVMLAERRPSSSLEMNHLEWAASDHAAGAAKAVRHLHAQGHRRIGLIIHTPSRSNPQLTSGWRAELERLGEDPGKHLLEHFDSFNGSLRHDQMEKLLMRCRDTRTTAVIVNPDPAALAFEQHCADAGLLIPEELAIIAYDDELASLGQPPITAVLPPKYHVGRLTVELLVARLLEGDQRPPHRVEIAPVLNIRESTEAAHDV